MTSQAETPTSKTIAKMDKNVVRALTDSVAFELVKKCEKEKCYCFIEIFFTHTQKN